MENVFLNANWIWTNDENKSDEYVQFRDSFIAIEKSKCIINICSDSNYTLWVNNEIAAFGQYVSFPDKKFYDSIDISSFIKTGNNLVAILVWYYGDDSFTYVNDSAGLIYEITNNNNIISSSGESTQCRIAKDYTNHRCERITSQLGLNYEFDARYYDNWNMVQYSNKSRFNNAITKRDINRNFFVRPVESLALKERTKSEIISAGSFIYSKKDRISECMQDSDIFQNKSFEPLSLTGDDYFEFSNKNNDGIFVLIDIGREEAGFLNLELEASEGVRIDIGFGEHIIDNKVRTAIGTRNFNVNYICSEGKQEFVNTFRRLGCRYLQLFVHSKKIKIKYIGIVPTDYPVKVNEFKADNILQQKIYDVSLRTLLLCMHEHYEDCPWREQALYTMDSRNQMLFGYYAFSEYKFVRANLKLISFSQRDDKLLAITAPTTTDLAIPSFTLIYLAQMWEYIEFSGDCTLAEETYDILVSILKVFINKIKSNGLIDNFINDGHWNFYEWTQGQDGGDEYKVNTSFDAPLNAFFSIALNSMAKISASINKIENADYYMKIKDKLNQSIFLNFYDDEKKIFKTFIGGRPDNHYSELTNSLILYCGACQAEKEEFIEQTLMQKNNSLVKISISHSIFKYDALLKKEKYNGAIVREIEEVFGKMVEQKATTFWETENGESDFGGAGSLCHGWSAVPIYIFNKVRKANDLV